MLCVRRADTVLDLLDAHAFVDDGFDRTNHPPLGDRTFEHDNAVLDFYRHLADIEVYASPHQALANVLSQAPVIPGLRFNAPPRIEAVRLRVRPAWALAMWVTALAFMPA